MRKVGLLAEGKKRAAVAARYLAQIRPGLPCCPESLEGPCKALSVCLWRGFPARILATAGQDVLLSCVSSVLHTVTEQAEVDDVAVAGGCHPERGQQAHRVSHDALEQRHDGAPDDGRGASSPPATARRSSSLVWKAPQKSSSP